MTPSPSDRLPDRRNLIDKIAYSRARCVRIALLSQQLYRPDPDGVETQADRAGYLLVLKETLSHVQNVATILDKGIDPDGKIDLALCRWVNSIAVEHPDILALIKDMIALSQKLITAAEQDPTKLGQHLRKFNDFRKGPFIDTVGQFCDALWSDIDRERCEEIARAQKSGEALEGALKKLEGIGKHVRLVSLNASVEAARVGDAGRGLGVISVEFKKLAEEIQEISSSARTDIDRLIGQ